MALIDLLNAFSNYSHPNFPAPAPGDADIAQLRYLQVNGTPVEEEGTIAGDAALVLVLVEPRLLADLPGAPLAAADLASRLVRYRDDLQAEGFVARLVEARVYGSGPGQTQHRDGRTVLALREFLRAAKAQFPRLRAAILVGSFPEALWVDQSPWVHQAFDGESVRGVDVSGRRVLGIEPGIAAYRTEIVLADLSGHWENLYHPGPEALPSLKVLLDGLPIGTVGDGTVLAAPQSHWELTSRTFEDFFLTLDADLTWPITTEGDLDVQLRRCRLSPEVGEAAAASNPISIPDIQVSRINARHIAVVPDRAIQDAAGRGLVDGGSVPRAIVPTSAPPGPNSFWVRDAAFERRLMTEYFDRNHAYRRGAWDEEPLRFGVFAHAFGPEAIADIFRSTSANLAELKLDCDHGTLAQFMQSLHRPMALRGIDAHAQDQGTLLGESKADELAAACGGRPHHWTWENDVLFPRFDERTSLLEFGTLRSAHACAAPDVGPGFYMHAGCDVNTPGYADLVPYNAEAPEPGPYGMFQMAESLLFFGNGLGVMSRSKVFNDRPIGFGEAFGAGRFGDGWTNTFVHASMATPYTVETAPNEKITYTWSIIGDATLQLRTARGASARVAIAAQDPTAYDDPRRGAVRVVYPGAAQIHELYRPDHQGWAYGNPGEFAHREGIAAGARPWGYVTEEGATARVVYRTEGRRIGELSLQRGDWTFGVPCPTAPAAAGDPVGYVAGGADRVVYVTDDASVQELYLTGGAPSWLTANLSAAAGAPPASVAIGACAELTVVDGAAVSSPCVVYAGRDDKRLHALRIVAGRWQHQDLTAESSAPLIPADARPFAYVAAGSLRVLFRGADRHLHEVWWADGSWNHADLSQRANSPFDVAGDPHAISSDGTAAARVYHRTASGALIEIALLESQRWSATDLSAGTGAPTAVGNPFAVRTLRAGAPECVRVAYRGEGGRLHALVLLACGEWSWVPLAADVG